MGAGGQLATCQCVAWHPEQPPPRRLRMRGATSVLVGRRKADMQGLWGVCRMVAGATMRMGLLGCQNCSFAWVESVC